MVFRFNADSVQQMGSNRYITSAYLFLTTVINTTNRNHSLNYEFASGKKVIYTEYELSKVV